MRVEPTEVIPEQNLSRIVTTLVGMLDRLAVQSMESRRRIVDLEKRIEELDTELEKVIEYVAEGR